MQHRRTAAAIAAIVIAASAAACSSSGSSSTATSGAETLHGAATGSAAAANFNSNSNTLLKFPTFTYAGPVALTVSPFTLPGGNSPSGTNTLPGGLRVHHVSTLPGSGNPNTPPPAVWTLKGTNCYFTATFDKGNYTVVSGSTGKFKGATGHGTYVITAGGWAPLAKGKSCSFNSIGPVAAQGASIAFTASGPLAVPA
jgi:hypothetical protein